MKKPTKSAKVPATKSVEKTVKKETLPAPPAPGIKAKVSDDELQARIIEAHAKFGVPKSFRTANIERLQAVIGETKVSELKFNAATRDAKFLSQWMRWALSEYKKLAAKK
jgi:hypothetical protein